MAAPWRLVESRRCDFGSHRLGGVFQGDQHSELGLLPLDDATQIANVLHAYVPGFKKEDNELELVSHCKCTEIQAAESR